MINAQSIIVDNAIKVSLGDKDYSIKLRSVRKATEWKQKFQTIQNAALDLATNVGLNVNDLVSLESGNVNVNAMDAIKKISEFGMVNQPQSYIDLFFEYDETLPREEIEDIASVYQIAHALVKVIEAEYPFRETRKSSNEVNSQACEDKIIWEVYEFCLMRWGLDSDYILDRWSTIKLHEYYECGIKRYLWENGVDSQKLETETKPVNNEAKIKSLLNLANPKPKH